MVTIDQNRWSRSVKFTGHDLLEWVVTVDQNTHHLHQLAEIASYRKNYLAKCIPCSTELNKCFAEEA